MSLGDFVKTWRVLPNPAPVGEQADHKIKISVIAADDVVGIECTDNQGSHAFHIGRYREACNRVVGSDFKIQVDTTVTPNLITFSKLDMAAGSWTAEDSASTGGGQ